MALLVSTLVVRGGTGYITDGSPQWGKPHPGYKKYQKLVENEKWQQAADILRKFDTSRDFPLYHHDYAEVFRKAGDVASGLAQLEQRLHVLDQNPEILKDRKPSIHFSNDLLGEIYSVATYAKTWGERDKIRSKLTILNACILYRFDDYLGAFLMAERITQGELGADYKLEFQRSMAMGAWEMANKNADWTNVVEISLFLKNHYSYATSKANEIGLSCEKVGNFPLALHFFEASIANSATDEEKIQRAKTVAAFVKQHGLQSEHWLVKCILLHEGGQTIAAIELLDGYDGGIAYLKEILRPAFDQAYANSDWTTAAQIAGYTVKITPPPDGEYLLHILEAMEKSGKPEFAMEFCLNSLWVRNYSSAEPHTCDPQGDPELVKRAAEIALRHQLAPKDPLVSAWLLHLQGKSDDASAQLRAFLGEKDKTKDMYFQTAVCRFLLGDIALAKDDLRKALTWYYYATYFATSHLATDSSRHSYQPHYESHYHEVLGVARQSGILARMGKPDLAAEELAGLLRADPSIESTIKLNTTLQTEWQQATALIEKARQQGVTVGAQYSEDLVTSDGVLKPRFSSARSIAAWRKKLTATIKKNVREDAQRSLAERKQRQARADAEQEAKEKREAELEAKLEAFRAEQQAQERARNATYQDTLNAGKKANSQRRCASCLGSGKAGYVTGSTFQSTTTGQQVAAPACSSCNGTGWR